MAKKINVRHYWSKSPTSDVSKVEVFLSVNGTEERVEFGSEVTEFVRVIEANSAVTFKVVVTDSEGLTATSETHAYAVGDLEAPLPATYLGHEFLAVIDDAPPA